MIEDKTASQILWLNDIFSRFCTRLWSFYFVWKCSIYKPLTLSLALWYLLNDCENGTNVKHTLTVCSIQHYLLVFDVNCTVTLMLFQVLLQGNWGSCSVQDLTVSQPVRSKIKFAAQVISFEIEQMFHFTTSKLSIIIQRRTLQDSKHYVQPLQFWIFNRACCILWCFSLKGRRMAEEIHLGTTISHVVNLTLYFNLSE